MNQSLITENKSIIVGFSGGPDSVYLLEQLYKLKDQKNLTLVAAHLDHEWRSTSAQDTKWCKEWCEKKEIPFVSKKISELKIDEPKTGSREASARLYRRYFLESITQQYPNSLIALGHHRDDQIETFFIRLARGTTLAGLGCIREQDGIYIRPLLNTAKSEILATLKQNNSSYLTDPSNQDTTLLRNAIRAELIPKLEAIDPRFINNIERTINHLQNNYQAFESLTKNLLQTISRNGNINCSSFLSLHESVQYELLSKLLIHNHSTVTQSQKIFAEIIRFIKEGTQQKHKVHPTCHVLKKAGQFSIVNPEQ